MSFGAVYPGHEAFKRWRPLNGVSQEESCQCSGAGLCPTAAEHSPSGALFGQSGDSRKTDIRLVGAHVVASAVLTSRAGETQNSTFNPNWIVRGLFACELITPN